jgi:hypothetical protein
MRQPLRALKEILRQRRVLAQREQQVLSRLLDAIPDLASSNGHGRKPPQKASGRKALGCRRCDRRFALPMHLGRHMAMSHKRKTVA